MSEDSKKAARVAAAAKARATKAKKTAAKKALDAARDRELKELRSALKAPKKRKLDSPDGESAGLSASDVKKAVQDALAKQSKQIAHEVKKQNKAVKSVEVTPQYQDPYLQSKIFDQDEAPVVAPFDEQLDDAEEDEDVPAEVVVTPAYLQRIGVTLANFQVKVEFWLTNDYVVESDTPPFTINEQEEQLGIMQTLDIVSVSTFDFPVGRFDASSANASRIAVALESFSIDFTTVPEVQTTPVNHTSVTTGMQANSGQFEAAFNWRFDCMSQIPDLETYRSFTTTLDEKINGDDNHSGYDVYARELGTEPQDSDYRFTSTPDNFQHSFFSTSRTQIDRVDYDVRVVMAEETEESPGVVQRIAYKEIIHNSFTTAVGQQITGADVIQHQFGDDSEPVICPGNRIWMVQRWSKQANNSVPNVHHVHS